MEHYIFLCAAAAAIAGPKPAPAVPAPLASAVSVPTLTVPVPTEEMVWRVDELNNVIGAVPRSRMVCVCFHSWLITATRMIDTILYRVGVVDVQV